MDNPFLNRKKALDSMRAERETKRQASTGSLACPHCGALHSARELEKDLYICPACSGYLPYPARLRLQALFDNAGNVDNVDNVDNLPSFNEFGDLPQPDPISFPGYPQKLAELSDSTGLPDAAVTASGTIGGHPAIAVAIDTRFLMGSMGWAVGQTIALSAEAARERSMPLIVFAAGGGARMQEGIVSLMQMAKTSAAIGRLSNAGGLYIAVLTHPTTGGVTASYASLADITLAEPGALVGFAGPRVIEATIKEKLPEGFQSSEFQMAHGFVDEVVKREQMKETIARLLKLHTRKTKGREGQ